MGKSVHNELTWLTPFIISLGIHLFFFSILLCVTYTYYTNLRKSLREAA